MNEFDLIKHFFYQDPTRSEIKLGIGDDAAILDIPPGHELITSVDSQVQGSHFLSHADPEKLGWKSLAIALSDCAAMGALPIACLLSITLSDQQPTAWLQSFSKGFHQCAKQYQTDLIGGNTARGPLNISVTVFGLVPSGTALTRHRAQPGDWIFISNELGKHVDFTHVPFIEPQIDLGNALRPIATSCIDISDGLLADLGHILQRSGVGAEIDLTLIPHQGDIITAISHGEDYQLCFTCEDKEAVYQLADQLDIKLSLIGKITTGTKLLLTRDGKPIHSEKKGFLHFI